MILGRLFGGSKSEQESSGRESDLDKQYQREKIEAELADGHESSDYEGIDDWVEDWQGVEREGMHGDEQSSDDDEDGGEMMPIFNF